MLTDEVLELLAADDPIMAGELARRRAAREASAAAEAIPPPASTAELLGRIRERPAFVPMAAEALARDFDDSKSWKGLHALCRMAFEGVLEPEALQHGYARALGPKARNPGAIFTIEARNWRPGMST